MIAVDRKALVTVLDALRRVSIPGDMLRRMNVEEAIKRLRDDLRENIEVDPVEERS